MLGNDKNPIREGGEITPDLGVRGDTREQGGGTWGQREWRGERKKENIGRGGKYTLGIIIFVNT